MNSLMFESFLYDDYVESSLDMELENFVRISSWVAVVIGKFGCSCGWVKALVKVSWWRCNELVVGWMCILQHVCI